MTQKKLFTAIIIAAFLSCGPKTGTITETDSGIVGKVSYTTGTSAVHASVQLFGARDTSRLAISSSSTDQNGNYDFHKLTPGAYNVWVESQDSLLALIDSVYVPQDSEVIANATLYKAGSITAVVVLQPGHSPTSVFVQALGTQRYSNVDDSGWFTVKGLAQGEYTLRLVSTIPGYTPTYKSIAIASGVNDTLKDTIYMVYSGIPIVTGIQASFDDYTGVVKISWRKVTYRDFYEYKVYREVKGVLNPQPVLIAVSPDSCFIYDTLYTPKIPDSVYDAGDTIMDANVNYRYRVTIVNKSMDEGQKYEFADVAGKDPAGLVSTLTPVQNQKFKDSVGLSCSWNKVSSAAKYEMQLSQKSDFSSILFDSVTTDTMKTMPKLGINYYYLRIRALDSAGVWGFWNCIRRFAVVGDLFATEILGTNNLNATEVAATVDGGFIIEGETINRPTGHYFIKTDSLGKEIWRLTYAPTDLNRFDKVTSMPDGSILILGEDETSPVVTSPVVEVLKIGLNGSLIWRKEFQDNAGIISNVRCIAKQDNGFILSYRTTIADTGAGPGHLIICNADGVSITSSIIDSCWNYDPFMQIINNDSIVVLTSKLSLLSNSSDSNHLCFNFFNFSENHTSNVNISVNGLGYVYDFNLINGGGFKIFGLGHTISPVVCILNGQFQETNLFYTPFLYKVPCQLIISSDTNLLFFNGFDMLEKTTAESNIIWEKKLFSAAFVQKSDETTIAVGTISSSSNFTIFKISKNGLSFEK